MSAWSFCLTHQADVLATADRRCPEHGTPVLPPSWGSHRQQWQAGQWQPVKPRPEGYVYVRPSCFGLYQGTPTPPHVHRKPAPKKAAPAANRFQPSERPVAAVTVVRHARTNNPKQLEPKPCRGCQTIFQPPTLHQGGPAPSYCSLACRQERERARKRQARRQAQRAETAA